MNHFVVLTRIRGNRYTLHDPGRGQVVLNRQELAKHFTRVVLELTPTQEFEPRVEKQQVSLWELLAQCARSWWRNDADTAVVASARDLCDCGTPVSAAGD